MRHSGLAATCYTDNAVWYLTLVTECRS